MSIERKFEQNEERISDGSIGNKVSSVEVFLGFSYAHSFLTSIEDRNKLGAPRMVFRMMMKFSVDRRSLFFISSNVRGRGCVFVPYSKTVWLSVRTSRQDGCDI